MHINGDDSVRDDDDDDDGGDVDDGRGNDDPIEKRSTAV